MEGREKIEYIEYQGAIHIHSKYSDGSGSMPEIISAARKVGLDFIVVTDHNTLKAKADGWEGWHKDLLVIVGQEISHSEQHCLALGLYRRVRGRRPPESIVEDIATQGGLSFIVHPHGKYRSLFRMKNLEWKNWELNSYTGIEIWSYMFDWIEKFKFYKWREFYKNPESQITGPFPETMARWDRLCQERKVVGIGGLDVHARKFGPYGILTVFPYEQVFRTLRTHVLVEREFTGEIGEDSRLVLGALAGGHCFLGYDLLGQTSGFRFRVIDGEEAIMGDEISWRGNLQMEVTLPRQALLRILRNGQTVEKVNVQEYHLRLGEPGVYRIEAAIDGRPWIYSNPIYIR